MKGASKTVQAMLLLKSTQEEVPIAKISHGHEGLRQLYLELRENCFQEGFERHNFN